MKVLRAIITSLLITSFLAVPVFATSSLDDVVNEVEVGGEVGTEEPAQEQAPTGPSQSFTDGIEQAGNVSANLGDANKVAAPLKEGVGFIVGILATAIPLLLVLRVMLDLLYIFIPFSRSLLGGGAPQQSSGGMGGGGFGGGGFGGGGFGGGGFGGSRGMGMSGGGQQQSSGGIQWISNQALNAVAAESGGQQSSGGMGGFGGGMSQQPQGGGQSAFKIYSKDMVITLTVAPIMLILAISGVLTSLGTTLGVAAVSAIQNLIGMI